LCIIDDLNVIAKLDDKLGGRKVVNSFMREFNAMITRGGLIDLGYHGPLYTWINRRRNSHRLIMEILDRSYVKVLWNVKFSDAKVYHFPRFNSDRTILLLCLQSALSKFFRQFKFEKW
jgi:uncharacterized protein YebE (UPF0316 family)